MKKRVAIWMLVLWAVSASSVEAQALLAPDTILLGDQTTVTTAPGVALQIPDDVVLVDQRPDSASGTMQSVVTSFEPGSHWLHAGDDSVLLTVLDIEVDTASSEIRDIAPIERVPYTFWEIFRWVLLALAVAALGVGLWWVLTHRRRLQEMLGNAEPVDTRDPHQRAADSLEELRQQCLWQSGRVKEYHTALTDIVRRFIEESTGIRATDMTSDETVESVAAGKWKAESALLRSIFATADLVKFAKGEPQPHEHEASLRSAITFVDQLWEQVKPKEEEVAHE